MFPRKIKYERFCRSGDEPIKVQKGQCNLYINIIHKSDKHRYIKASCFSFIHVLIDNKINLFNISFIIL